MKIAIVTDTWNPEINGVVTTYEKTATNLRNSGHEVRIIHPGLYKSIPCPTYPSIRLSLSPYEKTRKMLDAFTPEFIHIATEGPLGLSARRYCLKHDLAFTSAFHTRFAEYVRLRAPIPLSVSYAYLRWFHKPASRTLVPTYSLKELLNSRGFSNLEIWGRGVDTDLFKPKWNKNRQHAKTRLIYVGRIAVEKNIEAFLAAPFGCEKILVGDGPDRKKLELKYPHATFVGFKKGQALVDEINSSDVLVFPSTTDTFGIVMLEAMACGVPVAAYPVEGPQDVISQGITGYMHKDLCVAIEKALEIDSETCRRHVSSRTWSSATTTFINNLKYNPRRHFQSRALLKQSSTSEQTS